MLEPERILGALIRQGFSGGSRRSRSSGFGGIGSLLGPGVKGAVGLGLVGVAIAAFDHFSEQRKQAAGAVRGTTPALPSPPGPTARPSGPPPPPAGVPAPPRDATAAEESRQQAVLLIRAMVAAAGADGVIDRMERRAIMGRLFEAGLGEADREFVEREMEHPPRVEELLPAIREAGLAEQAYAVTLLAIEVDTPAEQDYVNYLRLQLGIDERMAEAVQRQLGINPD